MFNKFLEWSNAIQQIKTNVFISVKLLQPKAVGNTYNCQKL